VRSENHTVPHGAYSADEEMHKAFLRRRSRVHGLLSLWRHPPSG
jgi:hypothetical protein